VKGRADPRALFRRSEIARREARGDNRRKRSP
jgi:hypothetical protein